MDFVTATMNLLDLVPDHEASFYDFDEWKNDYGIEPLDIMLKFIDVVESKNGKPLNRFKSFLVCKIKRGISIKEEIALHEAFLKYIESDAGTKERMDSMKTIFALEFLEKKTK